MKANNFSTIMSSEAAYPVVTDLNRLSTDQSLFCDRLKKNCKENARNPAVISRNFKQWYCFNARNFLQQIPNNE